MTESFVKRNRSPYPDQLLCEAHGLESLRRAAAGTGIDVPEVFEVGESSLQMARIHPARCQPAQWQRLGAGLARIHSLPQPAFGFDEDNHIGLNPQRNTRTARWSEFFIRNRLQFQIGLVQDRARRDEFERRLARGAARLAVFLERDNPQPSLLHGDLWNGNVLCGEDGRVWLIDPACYWGDSDADLAMTGMFGGFPRAFYAAYRALRPAPPGYPLKSRI